MSEFKTVVSTCVLLAVIPCLLALGPSDQPDDTLTYTVKPGDTLSKIATKFGNMVWWVDIYEKNQQKIDNPGLIFPGQKLDIPAHVAFQNILSLDLNRVMAMKRAVEESREKARKAKKKSRLKKFRKAFEKLTESEKRKANEEQTTDYEGLGLGGMVLDETRSKMGSNFYSIFYNHWEAPENAQTFTLTIREQPVPSRGTMIMIELDDQPIFRHRLEPRYYKTEQAAKQAAQICRRRLQQQMATQTEFQGY